jgi:hypothetical protein
MPIIYKCLEDNNELWTPCLPFTPGVKEYIQMYSSLKKAYRTNNFSDLPPPEKFNQKLLDIIHNKLNKTRYIHGINHRTGYANVLKLHQLLFIYRNQ